MNDVYAVRYRPWPSIALVAGLLGVAAIFAVGFVSELQHQGPVWVMAILLLLSVASVVAAIDRTASLIRRIPCIAVDADGVFLGGSLIGNRFVPWPEVARVRLYQLDAANEGGRWPPVVHLELRDGTATRRIAAAWEGYDHDAMVRACTAFASSVPVSVEGRYWTRRDPLPFWPLAAVGRQVWRRLDRRRRPD